LGDPIEAQALLATYGQARPVEDPVWLGSVKSNIAHTAGAAGVAGVIKMVMAMRQGVLPASLHVDEPTPHVDWSAGAVRLLTENRAWPQRERPWRAGVSSFGISGTNAHVIIEQALDPAEPVDAPAEPADTTATTIARGVVPWVVSAHSRAALTAQAARLAEFVEADAGVEPADVGLSLVKTRATFKWRACMIGSTRDDLLAGLAALAQNRTDSRLVWNSAPAGGKRPRAAMMFSGGDGRPAGTGRDLYARFPVFKQSFDEVCAHFEPPLEQSLRDLMSGADATAAGDAAHTAGLGPAARFAFEVALFRLMRDFGVRPDYLMGTALGEITAAHLAGVLTAADACALVTAWPAQPAGTEARAEAVRRFGELARSLTYAAPGSTLVSTTTGEVVDAAHITTPEYWQALPDAPAQTREAVQHLVRGGVSVFLEPGPDTGLVALADEYRAEAAGDTRGGMCTALVKAELPEPDSVLAAMATMFAHRVELDWGAAFAGAPARVVELPTYQFQRRRYWFTSSRPEPATPAVHPFLGAPVELADPSARWFAQVLTDASALSRPALLEWAVAAVRTRADERCAAWYLHGLRFGEPLSVPDGGSVELQTTVSETGDATRALGYGRPARNGPWQECFTVAAAGPLTTPPDDRPGPRADHAAPVPIAVQPGAEGAGRLLNPAVLDACLRLAGTLIAPHDAEPAGDAWLPTGIDHVEIWAPLPDRVLCRARLRGVQELGECSVDLEVTSETEEPLMTMRGLSYEPVPAASALLAAGRPVGAA
jgi:acyl transferase domain-containing protein